MKVGIVTHVYPSGGGFDVWFADEQFGATYFANKKPVDVIAGDRVMCYFKDELSLGTVVRVEKL